MATNDQHAYLDCIQKGRRPFRGLSSFRRSDRSFGRLEDLYWLDTGLLSAPPDLETTLSAWGISYNGYTFVDVRSQGTTNFDDVVYSNRFNPRHGIILAIENDKSRDTNPPEQRLWPSEALWQSYRLVAEDERISLSNLRIIGRHCVVNRSTKNAIRCAAQLSTCSDEGNLGYKMYTELDDGFYAILGSVNGASTMRMLMDHKSRIGYRTIDRIAVLPLAPQRVNDEDPARTIFIVLSNPRHPPTKIAQPVFGAKDFPKRIERFYKKRTEKCRSQHHSS